MVMGVPESGIAAAEGYARASGIPYGQGLVKNRYIGRTLHRADARSCAARPCGSSSTRCARTSPASASSSSTTRSCAGTTQQQLTRMLREAGAAEIHLRITSPPVRWPCFYGIDIGDRAELLAAQLDTIEEIRQYVGVDSLAYLTLDRLVSADGRAGRRVLQRLLHRRVPRRRAGRAGQAGARRARPAPAGQLERLVHEG